MKRFHLLRSDRIFNMVDHGEEGVIVSLKLFVCIIRYKIWYSLEKNILEEVWF